MSPLEMNAGRRSRCAVVAEVPSAKCFAAPSASAALDDVGAAHPAPIGPANVIAVDGPDSGRPFELVADDAERQLGDGLEDQAGLVGPVLAAASRFRRASAPSRGRIRTHIFDMLHSEKSDIVRFILLVEPDIVILVVRSVRDDIHKAAPVPRGWKRAIRACTRDADWRTESVRHLTGDIAKTLRDELSPQRVRQLREALNAPQPGLFVSNVIPQTSEALQPLARRTEEHLERLLARGRREGDALRDAIRCAIGERLEAHHREAVSYLLQHSGTAQLRNRLRRAVESVNVDEQADSIVTAGQPALTPRKTHLDLDADLRGGL